MAMWERHTHKLCPKGPSFSSSLLDAIYRSIDAAATSDPHKPQDHAALSRNNAARAEDDADSLRRAIMVEKWIENYTTTTTGGGAPRSTPRHFPSTSASSTDSSVFSSSSETESSSVSRSSPKSSSHKLQKSSSAQSQTPPPPASAKREGGGRFLKTKTRAQKIYGDMKKAKEPISPGGRISSFFNSIFSPRNMKTSQCNNGDEWSPMRKSKSMKDAATCALTSRSCLSKNASTSRGSKSKRSVRFCPVSVIVDDHCQPCGQKSIYNDEFAINKDMIDSLRLFEAENVRKYQVRDCYGGGQDLDDMSCASSDLFELENIGRLEYGEELPVYETTRLEMMNQRM